MTDVPLNYLRKEEKLFTMSSPTYNLQFKCPNACLYNSTSLRKSTCLGIDNEAFGYVLQGAEDDVRSQEGLGQRDAAMGWRAGRSADWAARSG